MQSTRPPGNRLFRRRFPCPALAAVVLLAVPAAVPAAEYRVHVDGTAFLPGATVPLWAEVETQADDNLVGVGLFSFAIDLALSGDAGATGMSISNVAINQQRFDDRGSNRIGVPMGASFVGTAGVTTDVFPPNFGSMVGEVTRLFSFNLHIPPTAQQGQTIVLTPSEGVLENLTVNDNFDPVSPQRFATTTITVIPEPAAAALILLAAGAWRRGREPRAG